MNGLPEPYANKTHVVVHGRVLVIRDHAPNSDGWRYHGIPADLSGDVVSFSHDDARPVEVQPVEPKTFGELTPERNLIEALALWAHGRLSSADLKETYLMFTEGQTA